MKRNNKKGFVSLIGLLFGIVIIGLLYYVAMGSYFGTSTKDENDPDATDSSEEMLLEKVAQEREQGRLGTPSHHRAVLDSAVQQIEKINERNRQLRSPEDVMKKYQIR